MSTYSSRNGVYTATINHLKKVVETTPLCWDPFPHIVIHPFFPDDIYNHLLVNLPAAEHYQAFAYEEHRVSDGSSTRGRFQLTNEPVATLNSDLREFWLGIRDALGCKALKNAVFHKLAPGLAIRFGLPETTAAEVPAYPLPELFRERSGYAIKPHPDTRKKIVTMQVALPQDERQAQLGTEFYTRSLNPLCMTREPRGFTISKTIPFLPNVAYAFSVLNTWRLKSWHGRTKLPAFPGERNSILNIWYGNAEHANPDIVREHYYDHVALSKAA